MSTLFNTIQTLWYKQLFAISNIVLFLYKKNLSTKRKRSTRKQKHQKTLEKINPVMVAILLNNTIFVQYYSIK